MKVNLFKTFSGLIPADEDSEKWYKKIGNGNMVHGNFKTNRNPIFHRKYFALLKIGYDNWHPGEINSKYGSPEKNFERFRKDIAIMAGYYDLVIRLDGTSRPQPKSISFSSMEQEEFEKLYSKTIDIFLKHIYGAEMDAEQIDIIVNQYLTFA